MIQSQDLKMREGYFNKLKAFMNTQSVKVITGIRRCGKSSLLKLMVRYLAEHGTSQQQIIEMNFESLEFSQMDFMTLYHHVKSKVVPTKRMYLFFDEIQRIEQWQDAVNSFRVDFDCDIYITGSNSYLLSSEFSTYLSGRYVEIKMLPLSFIEFLDFHDFTLQNYNNPSGILKYRVRDKSGELHEIQEVLDAYIRFGGMPTLAEVGLVQENALTLLEGIFSTVVMRDILEREKRRGKRQITDSFLLRKVCLFLADNIGNNTSISSIGNMLVTEKVLDEGPHKKSPAVNTVKAYVEALVESFMFYEIKRFDIKGREYLKTLGKYYIVDSGLRNFLLGFNGLDTGHMLENIVYLDLLRRGYDVAVGKIDNIEIDFVATKGAKTLYIQVTQSMADERTREREIKPLKLLKNGHIKMIIAREALPNQFLDGFPVIGLAEWLLTKEDSPTL
ncbi:MAG: ATP-binding protein [Spirochaetia bacterium]|nr:ATP-binding protein [Spirochaetia bacterium]